MLKNSKDFPEHGDYKSDIMKNASNCANEWNLFCYIQLI